QVRQRDKNAIYLNRKLAEIPGILSMRRRKEITQQSYFNFAFRLDRRELKGVRNDAFCRALNAELHPDPWGWEPPYQPLNKCVLYKPHTKRRHKLNAEYWKAINPRRFRLPVATDAYERTGVVIHHYPLLGTKQDMDDIAGAVAKVAENFEQLKGH
ncbi:MAG: DegT/DnrJ/EryC1/StrS family aminotransferase, partial [Proteobacteria bacterium]|nr:DegT/DnrJ/EryC1/StrS family aminotransferase [Pseudomonadota bacterium]